MRNLKSSTAFAMCLVLMAPAPISAQSAEKSYPCVSPSGDVVQNSNQLAKSLQAFLSGEEQTKPNKDAKPDTAVCDAVAFDDALEKGGEELAAAMDTAPEDRLMMLRESLEGADASAAAAVEQSVEAEAESASQEADPVAEAEVEAETEVEAEAEAALEADTPVETKGTLDTDTPVAEGEAEAEPVAEAEAEVEADVAAEAAPVEAEPAADDSVAVKEAVAKALEAEASAEAEVEVEAEAETAETTQEVADADVPVSKAGEADGEQLTDSERQELARLRAESEAPSAAAAAEQTDTPTETEAQMEAETVSEEDVRTSAEDFATSASGDKEVEAKAESDKGMSNFEKALMLGVGAAVVGSILRNGDQVVSNSGDRVVVERDGELRVLKNDDVLLRRPGAEVQTQTFNDGSTRTIVSYEDGRQIITIRSPEGTVLRRTLIRASDGSEYVLFDDTATSDPVDFEQLPELTFLEERQDQVALNDQDALRVALRQSLAGNLDRSFSLRQVREYKRVRALAPKVDLEALTFATGSAAIRPSQAEELSELGFTIRQIIDEDPTAVFLVEGHTDAVGSASYNLALSDRRAETVALALTEYFDVPPQNLVTQGYGESDLKVRVLTDEPANRRAAVRNITDLLD